LTGLEEVVEEEAVLVLLAFVVVEAFVVELVLPPRGCPAPPLPAVEADVVAVVCEIELVVLAAEVVEDVDAAAVDVDAAPGRMTLRLTVAPHSSRVWSLSQQPPSVQYWPASQ
jgi:hypothetical protein